MKLKELAVGYIEIPLVTPFKTALRTVNSVNDLIVKVTAEDGTEGYGRSAWNHGKNGKEPGKKYVCKGSCGYCPL